MDPIDPTDAAAANMGHDEPYEVDAAIAIIIDQARESGMSADGITHLTIIAN